MNRPSRSASCPRLALLGLTLILAPGAAADDCNGNGVDDSIDIANGSSQDCNANAVPDECDLIEILDLELDFDGSSLPPGVSLSTSSLWHVGSACRPAGSCGAGNFAYFGLDTSCTFDTGNIFGDTGRLTVHDLVLPHSPELELSFCSYYEGEGGAKGDEYDLAIVWIEESGQPLTADFLEWTSGESTMSVWEPRALDISHFAGKTVDITFYFSSGDDQFNAFFGWGVDDIRVRRPGDLNGNGLVDDCECRASNDCSGLPNSVGPGARIDYRGTSMVHRNDFELVATALPPSQSGIFYFGIHQANAPFGDGLRCIGAPTWRLPVVSTGSGEASYAYDFTLWTDNPGNHLHAGITAYFQFWYRDPGSGAFGFNLSDSLALTFCE